MTKKSESATMVDEVERLNDQSEQLRKLTRVPALKTLSRKRYEKLVRQLEKIERSIEKMTKLLNK